MSVSSARPKLSLPLFNPAPVSEPISIVDDLRNSFRILNDKMFEQINKPELKIAMTNISESCLRNFGQSYSCNNNVPVQLKLHSRAVSNNFFIGDDHYTSKISSVYVYSCDEFVYKRTSFFINDFNCFFKLVLQICLQKYAYSLNCGMKVPQIYDCILFQTGDYLSLEIKMEKIQILGSDYKHTISQNYEYFMQLIKSGLQCFERNRLYHNDTHSENIGFYIDNGFIKVVLMDFGKATLTNSNRYQSSSGFYEQINNKVEFDAWLSHTIHVNTGRRSFYGGRKKRNTKKQKQRKRKTRRQRK
jgi:hypothetical protein